MSHTVISPSKALHSFTLTQEQVLNIAASLASDLGSAEDLMPDDFQLRHHQLLDMFMSKLTAPEKLRIINSLKSLNRLGVTQ
jgi:hypothetical protein